MEMIVVLDFGGQYNQLIARRVRECHVYCEIKPYTTPLADLMKLNPKGFIFTGGPGSVYEPDSPQVDPAIFQLGLPILGHLLRLPADGTESGRQRGARPGRYRPGVRQNPHVF